MIIQKEKHDYLVTENVKSWTVKRTEEKITISYNVPKSICRTFDDLTVYVRNNPLF